VLLARMNFIKADVLEGRNGFPPSCLVSLLDQESGDTLNLVGPESLAAELASMEPFEELAVELKWRRVDLAALGGSGRGKAYRLSVVRVANGGAA
jgi:hypothetical protein